MRIKRNYRIEENKTGRITFMINPTDEEIIKKNFVNFSKYFQQKAEEMVDEFIKKNSESIEWED